MTNTFMPPIERAPTHRNDTLKIIALVTMLIDHIGAIFFPETMLWRTIGRIAFPIFSWQLVEGYVHTSNRLRYGLRLFLFGCVSQIPYMFMNPELTFNPLHINIMFQLFSGILLLAAYDQMGKAFAKVTDTPLTSIILSFFWVAVSAILIIAPDLMNVWNPGFRFSYGTYGQLMFLVFYLFRGRPIRMAAGYVVMSLFHALESNALWYANDQSVGIAGIAAFFKFWSNTDTVRAAVEWSLEQLPSMGSVFFQARSIIVLPILWIFENRAGKLRLNRWIAYWFYPVHMTLILTLKWLMLQGLLF
jgi:hypothetical protein